MTIGISATVVRDIQNDPLFQGDFKEQVSHLLVCPYASTLGVDIGKKPALVLASDADDCAGSWRI
ncbi:hypothetical protein A2U01_0057488, partial [Trifolium medium]|nr:hypothetical protein [Trifolium medium]